LSEAIDCRIYLCGRVTIERTPPSVDTAVNALVSKLRAALRTVGFPPDEKPASA